MSAIRLTPFAKFLIYASIIIGTLFFARPFLIDYFKKNNHTVAAEEGTVIASPADAKPILRLSGSNTMGASLMPKLAKAFMEKELTATGVEIQKVGEHNIEIVGKMPDGTAAKITINTQGSAEGLKEVAANIADIALYSGITESLPANLTTNVLALDGIAVIVHQNNKVQELSKTQIADIFSGKITDWGQVGGVSGTIKLYARPENSGTSEAFKLMIFNNLSAALHSATVFTHDSKELSDAVHADPNAIGFVSAVNIGNTHALGVSDAGAGVRYPTVFNIETEDYLLTRRLLLLTSTTNNDLVTRFIKFCEDDTKGQPIVEEAGFVGLELNNKAAIPTVVNNAPPAYLAAIEGATRLPTTLHFKSGSSKPDERARDDFGRIVKLLSQPENRKKMVLLLGFTDNVGNAAKNITLSIQRAQTMQEEFAKLGIKTETNGFGQALPIADNTTPIGQNRNRRVEVWMR